MCLGFDGFLHEIEVNVLKCSFFNLIRTVT